MMQSFVFITPQLKTGGGNRVFIELANELAGKNHKVDFVYPHNSEEKNSFNLNGRIGLHKIGKYSGNKLYKVFNIIRVFFYVRKNKKGSKIVVSDPVTSIFSIILSGMDVCRFIQADDYRIFDDLFLLKNRVILNAYKFFTKVSFQYKIKYIFNSDFSYSSFLTNSKRKDVEKNIVHPAINHKVFYDKGIRNNDKINICLIARKHPFKGFSDFINAWQGVKENLRRIIGEILILADDEALKIFDCREFTFIQTKNDFEIADVYNKAHIFISTSWSEGFGLPSLEAMACGCAVILTNAGGVNEYAVPGHNCLRYEPRNIEELKEKISTLAGDISLINKLSRNAAITAGEFSWQQSAEKFLRVLGA